MKIKTEVWPMLRETWDEFQKDEAGQRGAALAYYTMFSIFPLLILLLAALGFVLRYQHSALDAQQQLLQTAAQTFSPQFSNTLREMLAVIQDKAATATGAGLLTLLIGASGVFQQLDSSFNKIWRVPEPPQSSGWWSYLLSYAREKLVSFLMVLAVGVLLLLSFSLTAITQALLGTLESLPVIGGVTGYLLGLVVTLALNTVIFALLFRYLPDAEVHWRDVIAGAIATALLWEIAKRLLTFYVAHSSYVSAYGVVGTVLVLMVWIYFSSQVLFLGAEFTEVYSRHHGSRSASPENSRVRPRPQIVPNRPSPA